MSRYVYNGAGDLLTITDGKSQATQFGYDQFGRRTNQIDASGATVLRWKYDALGRLTNRWSLAKGDTFYSYDPAGNLTNINYPVSPDVSFTFDNANRLSQMVDGIGTTVFAYTSFGAVLSEDGPWSNDTVSYCYRTNHLRASLSVQQALGPSVVQSYDYDAANRLRTIAAPAGTFTYNYLGAGGLVQKIAYPSGAYVTNSYDSVGRLAFTKLKSSGNADLNSHLYQINAGNQRTRQTRVDGSYVDYGYDEIGQVKSATGRETNYTVRLHENLSYGYDAAGSLNYRTNNALVQTFWTDNRNQLTNVTRAGSLTVSGATSLAVTNVSVNTLSASRYADNSFAKEGVALSNGINSFTVIAEDSYGRKDTNVVSANLPASVSFTYDLNGNLTSDGSRTFTYDDENRLTRVEVANLYRTEFNYDGLGRRRLRDEYVWFNSAWAYTAYVDYIYDGQLVADERWAGGEPPVHYTRGVDLSGSLQGAGGIGGLLARSQDVSAAPQHHYYHADGTGNVTMLINANQQVTAKYLYDPFGKVLGISGWMADVNLCQFSSKEIHPNSGLVFFGNRFYDPSLQRWLSRDPIGIDGGINLYAYVGNGPVNAFDPWGEFPVTVSFSEGTAKRYKIRQISRETAVQLMGKEYVNGLDSSYNMFVVDSNALNPYLPSDTRMLTDGEYELANSIFGTTVNYGLVDVIKRKQNAFHPKDTLITPDGNIYANPNGNAYSSDYSSVALKNQDLPTTEELFIHEMTHVYQYQTGVNVLLGSGYRKYDYSYSNLGTLDWNKYGIEQRAIIVEDYFLVSNGLPKYDRNGNQVALPSIDTYRKVLSPYLPLPWFAHA